MLAEQRAVVEVLKHSCCAVPVPAGLHPLRRVFDLVDEGLRSVFEEALDVIQEWDVAHNVALADVSLDDGDGGDGLAQVAELLLLRAQTLEVVVVAAEDVGNSVRRIGFPSEIISETAFDFAASFQALTYVLIGWMVESLWPFSKRSSPSPLDTSARRSRSTWSSRTGQTATGCSPRSSCAYAALHSALRLR